MTRHEIRKEIFKIVFSSEFHDKEELAESVDLFLDNRDIAEKEDIVSADRTEEETAYIKDKSQAVIDNKAAFDEEINSKVTGWKTSRMSKVDLAILRLALYEAQIEKLDKGIVINEAVNLADEFGTDSSSSFVNGALAKLLN